MPETEKKNKPDIHRKGEPGGWRGGGRPKGSKSPRSLEKMAMRKYMEQRIMRASSRILTSQIHLATGQTFLYKIEKKEVKGPKGGTSYQNLPPKLVTSQYEIESYLEGIANGDPDNDQDPAATYYYLTTKEPNNEAIKNLFDRVHGKPKETLELGGEVKFSLVGLAKRREELKEGAVVAPVQTSEQPHE